MVKILVFLLCFLMCNFISAQKFINNEYYKVLIPNELSIYPFNRNHDNNSIIESYKLVSSDKLDFVLFLMSNKVIDSTNYLSLDNLKSFLTDFDGISINVVSIENDHAKVNFKYPNDVRISYLMYISIKGNILNRVLFIIPDEPEIYQQNIDSIWSGISFLRSSWNE